MRGCAALIRPPARFCPPHAVVADRQDRERRGSSAERGYDARWREYRKAFLANYPLCGMRSSLADRRIELLGIEWSQCKREKIVRPAEQVDHIIPHRGNFAVFWDPANHQALCSSCSNAKSARGM
mgnify:CR=1 FL=1